MVNKKGLSSLALGIFSAAVGAAAGAAAVVLSDKDNRKKVQNKIEEYEKDGAKIITNIKNSAKKLTSKSSKKKK